MDRLSRAVGLAALVLLVPVAPAAGQVTYDLLSQADHNDVVGDRVMHRGMVAGYQTQN